jgi:S1-C subfamily serine protease
VRVDGEPVSEPGDVTDALNSHEPGDSIKIEIERNGSREHLDVTLGNRP